MFIDTATIKLSAGNGGNGAVSFHREKYVAAGGPDGGDGGRGGSVVFLADDNLSTLMDFRYKRAYAAENGADGTARRCSGKNAPDLIIRVPRGTLVRDAATGDILADISQDDPVTLLSGGRGGWGNSRFATPTRQAPRFAKSGQKGQSATVTLELKLLADIGLVGLPNAGKSSLLAAISAARPKIADYPFTTLTPQLGVVRLDDERSFVVADIPGLIEGAADGVGLGHDFLRHIDRCRLLLHLVDCSGEQDPVCAYESINAELVQYAPELGKRPQIVCATKSDAWENEENFGRLQAHCESGAIKISSATGGGVRELMNDAYNLLKTLPPVIVYERRAAAEIIAAEPAFTIHRADDGAWEIGGKWLEATLRDVHFDDREALAYLDRVLRKSGLFDELEKRGINENDTVRMFDLEFDYIK